MAKFNFELPDDVIKDFEKINKNYEDIFGSMVHAGAEQVKANVLMNVPKGITKSEMLKTLDITKVYKTPSDDGINAKTMFNGYFINEDGIKVPAPLVANVFEYGRSNEPFPKQPFFRKAFKNPNVREAMLKMQAVKSGGLLENE